MLVWPDGLPEHSVMDHLYQWTIFLFTYLIPLMVMGTSYAKLGQIISRIQWQLDYEQQDKQVVRARNEMRKVIN